MTDYITNFNRETKDVLNYLSIDTFLYYIMCVSKICDYL